MKATEYEVVMSISLSELIEIVNNSIKDGWQPLGGITVNNESVHDDSITPNYYQAIVKVS